MNIEEAIEYCSGRKIAIHTDSLEKYDKLMVLLESKGYRWCSDSIPTEPMWFYDNMEETCVSLESGRITFGSAFAYLKEKYEILEVDE